MANLKALMGALFLVSQKCDLEVANSRHRWCCTLSNCWGILHNCRRYKYFNNCLSDMECDARLFHPVSSGWNCWITHSCIPSISMLWARSWVPILKGFVVYISTTKEGRERVFHFGKCAMIGQEVGCQSSSCFLKMFFLFPFLPFNFFF